MSTSDQLVKLLLEHYLSSPDFNGLPVSELPVSREEGKATVLELLKSGKADANFGDGHPNPHIKAFPAKPREQQILKAEALPSVDGLCLYPSADVLTQYVDPSRYAGKPFTLRLALGDGQLEYRAFDLTVLEHYRNDPRYVYNSNDISGWISVHDQHYKSDAMREPDKVVLETFGFCYDDDMNRAVAVFLRYLSDLSPEHQQIWAAKMVDGNYKLHPAYFDAAILGQRPEGVSIFDAFVHEQHHINAMCERIGKPRLFREEFMDDKRPRGFGFLIRPTLKEFNDFMLLLDRMMSDNLNVHFFEGDIEREMVEERKDGAKVVRPKGTITMLEEWFSEWFTRFFRPKDPGPMEEMVAAFKSIRKARQSPAHAIREDDFDQKYFKEQREIVLQAYGAVRTIRLMLTHHPGVKGYTVPDWLYEGRIWTQ